MTTKPDPTSPEGQALYLEAAGLASDLLLALDRCDGDHAGLTELMDTIETMDRDTLEVVLAAVLGTTRELLAQHALRFGMTLAEYVEKTRIAESGENDAQTETT